MQHHQETLSSVKTLIIHVFLNADLAIRYVWFSVLNQNENGISFLVMTIQNEAVCKVQDRHSRVYGLTRHIAGEEVTVVHSNWRRLISINGLTKIDVFNECGTESQSCLQLLHSSLKSQCQWQVSQATMNCLMTSENQSTSTAVCTHSSP